MIFKSSSSTGTDLFTFLSTTKLINKFRSRLFSASINRFDLLAMVLVMAVKRKEKSSATPKMANECEVGVDSSPTARMNRLRTDVSAI